jgi:transcription initiation factor IIE alpha subunit
MDSLVSSTLTEICLQFFEEPIIKHWKESGEISYYNVDVILIYDKNETSINNHMNNIHKKLEFKITEEENNINYLDQPIHRYNNKLNLGIYRKPTETALYISHPTTH